MDAARASFRSRSARRDCSRKIRLGGHASWSARPPPSPRRRREYPPAQCPRGVPGRGDEHGHEHGSVAVRRRRRAAPIPARPRGCAASRGTATCGTTAPPVVMLPWGCSTSTRRVTEPASRRACTNAARANVLGARGQNAEPPPASAPHLQASCTSRPPAARRRRVRERTCRASNDDRAEVRVLSHGRAAATRGAGGNGVALRPAPRPGAFAAGARGGRRRRRRGGRAARRPRANRWRWGL